MFLMCRVIYIIDILFQLFNNLNFNLIFLVSVDDDVEMYSDSGEDTVDDKPLHTNSTKEQACQEEPQKTSNARQMKTSHDAVNLSDITVSVEDERMSEGESEQVDEDMDADDSALLKEEKPVEQGKKEKLKLTSHSQTSQAEQPRKKPRKQTCKYDKNIIIYVCIIFKYNSSNIADLKILTSRTQTG